MGTDGTRTTGNQQAPSGRGVDRAGSGAMTSG
jgi:hypothetical protein